MIKKITILPNVDWMLNEQKLLVMIASHLEFEPNPNIIITIFIINDITCCILLNTERNNNSR